MKAFILFVLVKTEMMSLIITNRLAGLACSPNKGSKKCDLNHEALFCALFDYNMSTPNCLFVSRCLSFLFFLC